MASCHQLGSMRTFGACSIRHGKLAPSSSHALEFVVLASRSTAYGRLTTFTVPTQYPRSLRPSRLSSTDMCTVRQQRGVRYP